MYSPHLPNTGIPWLGSSDSKLAMHPLAACMPARPLRTPSAVKLLTQVAEPPCGATVMCNLGLLSSRWSPVVKNRTKFNLCSQAAPWCPCVTSPRPHAAAVTATMHVGRPLFTHATDIAIVSPRAAQLCLEPCFHNPCRNCRASDAALRCTQLWVYWRRISTPPCSGASAAHSMRVGVLRVTGRVAPVCAARLHVVEGVVPGVQQLVRAGPRHGVPRKAPQHLHAWSRCIRAQHAQHAQAETMRQYVCHIVA